MPVSRKNKPLLHCTTGELSRKHSKKPSIVFSFQGAFNPPHIGHYESMKAFARQVAKDYPHHDITMLFMPTARSNSKKHLLPTQQYRIQHLDYFCKRLANDFSQRLQFQIQSLCLQASTIEYDINPLYNGSTDTIHTIHTLKKMYPSATLLLGMGFDNCLQLLYWDGIEQFASAGVKAIYTVPRLNVSNNKRKVFYDRSGRRISFLFDSCVPWTLHNWSKVLKPKHKNDDSYIVSTDTSCHNVTQKFHTRLQCHIPIIRTVRMKKIDMSSSLLRKCIQDKTHSDQELLDKMVLDNEFGMLQRCKRFYRS